MRRIGDKSTKKKKVKVEFEPKELEQTYASS